MKILIILGGFFHIALFIFHLFFWKLFDWKDELRKVSFLNKNVMQLLNLALMAIILLFTYVSFAHTSELLSTGLGNTIIAGIAIVWFLRAVQQIIFFGLTTARSLGLFLVFLLAAGCYSIPLFV